MTTETKCPMPGCGGEMRISKSGDLKCRNNRCSLWALELDATAIEAIRAALADTDADMRLELTMTQGKLTDANARIEELEGEKAKREQEWQADMTRRALSPECLDCDQLREQLALFYAACNLPEGTPIAGKQFVPMRDYVERGLESDRLREQLAEADKMLQKLAGPVLCEECRGYGGEIGDVDDDGRTVGHYCDKCGGLGITNEFMREIIEGIENQHEEQLAAVTGERDGLLAFKRSVDEAINSGDGSYRP